MINKILYEHYTDQYLDEDGAIKTDYHNDNHPKGLYQYPYVSYFHYEIDTDPYLTVFDPDQDGQARRDWLDLTIDQSTYNLNLLKTAEYPGGLDDDSILYVCMNFRLMDGSNDTFDNMFNITNATASCSTQFQYNNGEDFINNAAMTIEAGDAPERSSLIINKDFRYAGRNILIDLIIGYPKNYAEDYEVPDEVDSINKPYICGYIDYTDEDNYKYIRLKYYFSVEDGYYETETDDGVSVTVDTINTQYQFLNLEYLITEVLNGIETVIESGKLKKWHGNKVDKPNPLTLAHIDWAARISFWIQYCGEDVVEVGFDLTLIPNQLDPVINPFMYFHPIVYQNYIQPQRIEGLPVKSSSKDFSYSVRMKSQYGTKIGFGIEGEGQISISSFIVKKGYYMEDDNGDFVFPENVMCYDIYRQDGREFEMSYNLDAKSWEANEPFFRDNCICKFSIAGLDGMKHTVNRFNNPENSTPRFTYGTDGDTLDLTISGVSIDQNWGWYFVPGDEPRSSPYLYWGNDLGSFGSQGYNYYYIKGGSQVEPTGVNLFNSTFTLNKITKHDNYNFYEQDLTTLINPSVTVTRRFYPPSEHMPHQTIYHKSLVGLGIATGGVWHTIIRREYEPTGAIEDFDFGYLTYEYTDLFIAIEEDKCYFGVGMKIDWSNAALTAFPFYHWNYFYPQADLKRFNYSFSNDLYGVRWFGIPFEDIGNSDQDQLAMMETIRFSDGQPNSIFINEAPYNNYENYVDEVEPANSYHNRSSKMNLRKEKDQSNYAALNENVFERSLCLFHDEGVFLHDVMRGFAHVNGVNIGSYKGNKTGNSLIWNKTLPPYLFLEVADFSNASISIKSNSSGVADVDWDSVLSSKLTIPNNSFTNPGGYPESLFNKVIN